MKILNVRFKNLNSLVGEWEIDFTLPAYTADGIFAITGPTGAGKTTILDAICLAIYGRTPRLERVNKSGNEIMSRHTGECFAEVTFETQVGRFRCHWAQHRARRKAEGELQVPRQEIANADTGEIFEVKKRDIADQVETVTGMDFDRFTRSMMLAQGGFAAFLQAAPDDRAPILEQITGTAIYSEISRCVHERQREEQDKLNLLKAETAGIELLEAGEEQAQREQLAVQEQQAIAVAAELTKVTEAITWLTGITTLGNDIARLDKDAEGLRAETDAFAPQRDRLAAAQRAAALDGDYATLTSLRRQQAQDQAALADQQQALPELEQSLAQRTQTHEAAERRVTEARGRRKEAEPLIQKVRSLDQSITDESKRVTGAQQHCDREEKAIAGLRDKLALEKDKLAETGDHRTRVETYLDEHARDEWLVAGFTGLEAQLATLAAKVEDIARKESDRSSAATALEQVQQALEARVEHCAAAENELAGVMQQVTVARAELAQLLDGKLLREYRDEKDALSRELNLLRQIAALEEHRARLEDGKPCPLCGAAEHPYAMGNVPTPDATEQKIESLTALITRAEEQEGVIRQLEKAEQVARAKVQAANHDRTLVDSQQASARKSLDAAVVALDNARREFGAQKQSVEEKLGPLGIATLAEGELDTVVDQLRQRRDAWQAAVDEKAEIERKRAAIQVEIQRQETRIEAQSKALAKDQKALGDSREMLEQHKQERKQLFGDRKPDEEMAALDNSVHSAEKNEKTARAERARLGEDLATAKSRLDSLREGIDKRAPELENSEARFTAALSSAAFSSEAQFAESRLTHKQRTELAAAAQTLDNRRTELQAMIKDRQGQLAREQKRQITDKTLEALQPERDALQVRQQDIQQEVARLKHRLQQNDEAKELLSTKQAAIEAQTRECRRWDNLHALIGSSDGKKYRNFAQGLTFEMMVGHANRQLQKMSDRYLLLRDPAQPLELNVVDNYQAGEVRSTKNLSGGESFIVSLSLALGLSQMASRNVRVDSLFLDEGFGTLDEEALDTALETLSGLQQEGKLIGVISHVQALKERISTQIQVTPQTGGRSAIAGPGCGKVRAEEDAA